MEWYKLIFKQNQPIHIGSSKWGVISETEIFIPGWTMWGALTNEYLKRIKFENIEDAKIIFNRITNFYPTIVPVDGNKNSIKAMFPEYKEGKLFYGNYSVDEFKFIFVDTIVSTAIEPLSRKAWDESLHEFEYILPRVKQTSTESNQNELYWVGLIGFESSTEKDIENKFLSEGNTKIYIGGDSRYGFGELELFKEPCKVEGEELIEWNLNPDGFLVYNKSDNLILRQFLEFSTKIKFEGKIVFLAEFDFTHSTPTVQTAGYYINAGSKILRLDSDLKNYQLVKGKFIKTI
ncbi:hypothetical protein EDC21_11810 [Thermohydrogenium kirishiense]|uniref:hypothetical protein n=1 Tax=Thermoanaerobacterium thermosaccharolyticum TaxID=1517 RepID=UPI001043BE4D|nr:hypothetical protein EDC21_11810 [Thermohydrogenium kirishiense]